MLRRVKVKVKVRGLKTMLVKNCFQLKTHVGYKVFKESELSGS